MFRHRRFQFRFAALPLLVFWLAAVVFTGCERKERVLDVETPGADVEVDRNIDTGEVEVDVTDKD
jgi:hypothetical protein